MRLTMWRCKWSVSKRGSRGPMAVRVLQDASKESTKLYLVLDINGLIDYLDVMERFDRGIEGLGLPMRIVIPNVLLSELDRCVYCFVPQHMHARYSYPSHNARPPSQAGTRDKIGWFTSRASAWILAKAKERRTVHIRARREICGLALTPHERERRNNMYIYDCCQFFARVPDGDSDVRRVVLLSGDVNLQKTVRSLNTDGTSRSGGMWPGAAPFGALLRRRGLSLVAFVSGTLARDRGNPARQNWPIQPGTQGKAHRHWPTHPRIPSGLG